MRKTAFRRNDISYSTKEEREKHKSTEKKGIFVPLGPISRLWLPFFRLFRF
jgi:hypothetical protein